MINLILHSLQPSRGAVNFILAQLYIGVNNEYQILVHPVILGSGKPLFQDIKDQTKLKLVNTKTHPSGVVVLSYQPERKE